MYLTYREYLEYGGAMDEPTFTRLTFKCEKLIDSMTNSRIRNMFCIPEAVKRCIFELLSQESIFEKNVSALASFESTGKLVSSFTTDGYQESYGGGGESSGAYLRHMREETDTLQKQTIRDFLACEYDDNNVKLLYRGVF